MFNACGGVSEFERSDLSQANGVTKQLKLIMI